MAKVMVSLPDDLLVEIDAHVRRTNGSRSAFLATAPRHELDRPDPEAIHSAVERPVGGSPMSVSSTALLRFARCATAGGEQGIVRARILDLTIYELGDVLARSLR